MPEQTLSARLKKINRIISNRSLGYIMKLNSLTLKFSGESSKLEAPFLSYYYRMSLPQLRIFLILGSLLYASFGILDAVLMPEQKYTIWFIRFIIVCPVILGMLLASFSKVL